MPADADSVRFGPFYLEARIAVGGTAEVYLARPVDPRAEPRRLAIKRLLPDLLADPDVVEMFSREGRLHAAVRHPNVVEVFGAGEVEGEPYLALEWIDGIDGYRLLRRLKMESRALAPAVAVHAMRELLSGLMSVHTARENGRALGIVHRDISPSNVYFAKSGEVKLGDFGIARDASRPIRSQASNVLKGKYAYLAPEQVASEPFDARADLFSAAVVLSEMLIGEPLFSGAGQLAVLLAIRDCRIDPLERARSVLPTGLFEVLARALARDPAARFPTADQLANALAPFDPDPDGARAEIARLVSYAARKESTDRMLAIRDSTRRMAARPPLETLDPPEPAASERPTGEYSTRATFVETSDGRKLGPWTFAQLVEALATGVAGRGDRIDYMGTGWRSIESLPDLARFLPPETEITSLKGPQPLYTLDLAVSSMLEAMLRVLEHMETGALFAADTGEATFGKGPGRKELYFVKGRLHHVASSNASELLGEYLVRRGQIAREELDMALAVLPRNQGRMGDTLISLGLVEPMTLFKAIREQGRDRVVDLFSWKIGRVAYFRGETLPHVEFPLDLDVASLVLAGLESSLSGDSALEKYRPSLGAKLVTGPRDRVGLTHVRWPDSVAALTAAAKRGGTLADAIRDVAHGLRCTAGDVARALEIVLAARLVALV